MADGAEHADVVEPFWFADWSKDLTQPNEMGGFRGSVAGVVTGLGDDGEVSDALLGRMQPRNWHISELGPIDPSLPDIPDRRIGVGLISDYENGFSGFGFASGVEGGPHQIDWAATQKSTRVINYLEPDGAVALFAQLARVTDDHQSEFSLAIPHGPTILGGTNQSLMPPADDPNHQTQAAGATTAEPPAGVDFLGQPGEAGAGLFWDGVRAGLTATFLAPIHEDDVLATGILGTDIGVQGIRRNTHVEWGDDHGPIFFQKEDIPTETRARGPYFKASLRRDESVAKISGPPGSPNVQWRAWYRQPNIQPEDETLTPGPTDGFGEPDGTGGGPSGGGTSEGDGILPPLDPFDPVGRPDPTGVSVVIGGLTGAATGAVLPIITGAYVSPEKQAYIGAVCGASIGADRTVFSVLQGASTATAAWGMTLPGNTQVGADTSDDPFIQWGHEDDTNHYQLRFLDGSGEMLSQFLTSAGAKANAQLTTAHSQDWQDLSGTSKYSVNPEGDFALVAADVTPGSEPAPGVPFTGKIWMEADASDASIGYRVDATGAGIRRVKMHPDPEDPTHTNMTITGKLTVGGLIDPTGVVVTEQTTVPGGAPAAGDGTFWVRDDVPNVPMFTDDAGTDHELLFSTAGGTKGDILVSDGTSFAPLAVGTDGFVLTANSATTEGVEWAAAAGGAGLGVIEKLVAAATL